MTPLSDVSFITVHAATDISVKDSEKVSGDATPGRARSNDLAGRSTVLAQALAPPCLALHIALLR